jgi:nuclear transport factor 2 (NTF2) superfamily protein
MSNETWAARPPLPPFDEQTAVLKVQAAEDAWSTRDPERVVAAYTEDCGWRNRTEFVTGRPAIIQYLTRKCEREQDYALRKRLWGFRGDRMAVLFQYEWHDERDQWWRLDLAFYEVTNIAVRSWRDSGAAGRLRERIAAIGDDGGLIRADAALLTDAANIAVQHGISVYDAVYVAASLLTEARLVICDQRDLVSKGLACLPIETSLDEHASEHPQTPNKQSRKIALRLVNQKRALSAPLGM